MSMSRASTFLATIVALTVTVAVGLCTRSSFAQTAVTNSPIEKFSYKVATSEHETHLSKLKQFAEKHEFAIRIVQTNAAGDQVSVQMFRQDFFILVLNPFSTAKEEFRAAIYSYCKETGQNQAAQKILAELKVEVQTTR